VGKGSFEIERRYLVRVDPGLWPRLHGGRHLLQGYVKTGDPSVRIRMGESRGPVLTVKGGAGMTRREVETVVSAEVATALMEAAGSRVLEKVRFFVAPWELDRFQGGFEGLTLLEIELADEGDVIPPPPEGVDIIREITDDNTLTSSGLAELDDHGRAGLVRKLYEA